MKGKFGGVELPLTHYYICKYLLSIPFLRDFFEMVPRYLRDKNAIKLYLTVNIILVSN